MYIVQYLYYVLFTQKGAQVNLENGVQLLLTLKRTQLFYNFNMFETFFKKGLLYFLT